MTEVTIQKMKSMGGGGLTCRKCNSRVSGFCSRKREFLLCDDHNNWATWYELKKAKWRKKR